MAIVWCKKRIEFTRLVVVWLYAFCDVFHFQHDGKWLTLMEIHLTRCHLMMVVVVYHFLAAVHLVTMNGHAQNDQNLANDDGQNRDDRNHDGQNGQNGQMHTMECQNEHNHCTAQMVHGLKCRQQMDLNTKLSDCYNMRPNIWKINNHCFR